MGEENEELDKYIETFDDEDNKASAKDVTGVEDVQDGADANAASSDNAAQDQNAEKPQEGDTSVVKEEGKQPDKSGKDAEKDQLRPLGDGVFADAKGNIVDKEGKMIAESGFAARMYQTNRRLRARLDDQTQLLETMNTRLQEGNMLMQAAAQQGLTNDDMARAIDLATRFKKGDVLSVAKDILAEVSAAGYNVSDLLGEDVGDSIDMKAITTLLDQRLGPIAQQRQTAEQEQQADVIARQQYNTFVNDNPYADIHGREIVQVVQREGKTLQQAYNALRTFAYRNNLDFSRPLAPQIIERQKQLREQQQNQNSSRQKPLPNGAGPQGGMTDAMPTSGADDDWSTIINRAIQAGGGV